MIQDWNKDHMFGYQFLNGCNPVRHVQDGAEDGSRVASSDKSLQVFVCFVCFFVVLRVRCC